MSVFLFASNSYAVLFLNSVCPKYFFWFVDSEREASRDVLMAVSLDRVEDLY